MLCAIMTIIAGVIRAPYKVSLGLFLLILPHIASKAKKESTPVVEEPQQIVKLHTNFSTKNESPMAMVSLTLNSTAGCRGALQPAAILTCCTQP